MFIYCDCQAGISGDMFLGALCHLGVDFTPLQQALADIDIECTLKTWQEHRAGGAGFRADVSWPNNQPLRHPQDIANIFQSVKVSQKVRGDALAILEAITLAEAHAHGIPPEEVHFHEVGAIDTVVDILGAAYGLHELGISRMYCSALPWFTGTVECEHGIIPLPAPATAFLLRNKPIEHTWPSLAQSEMVTPTGAALVHVLAHSFAQPPKGTILKMGTGYGSRKSPAGVRLWLMQEEDNAQKHEYVYQLESHLDHLTGEELGAALQNLSDMPEVLDVLWLCGTGKKNRPSGLLRVLCLPKHKNLVERAFFTHTHSLGIRHSILERTILPRKERLAYIESYGENIDCKEYSLDGELWLRPEAEALMQKARTQNIAMPALRIAKVPKNNE